VKPVPTHAALVAAIGQRFVLVASDEPSADARLAASPPGVPMDENYVRFPAIFELPPASTFPRTYFASRPSGRTTGTAAISIPATLATANTTLAPFNAPVTTSAPAVQVGPAALGESFSLRNPYLGLTCIIALQGMYPTHS